MNRLAGRWALSLSTLAALFALASCSDNDGVLDEAAGTPNAGHSGMGGPAGAGGHSAGGAGASKAGHAGAEEQGGAPDSDGGSSSEAGAAGEGGAPGAGTSAGSGGTPASGGASAGSGGVSGAPAGGAGGQGSTPFIAFDFEGDPQGFTTDGANVTIATSTAKAVSGTRSLKVTLPSLQNDNRLVFADGVAFWPGTKVELNVWVPLGEDDLYVQAFSLMDFYQWDATNSAAMPLVRGGWTKFTYTVPKTFPGGMQRLGIQFGAGARAFAGDVYVDAIATVDGPKACSGNSVTKPTNSPGSRHFDFESASPEWEVDANPGDVALSLSGAHVVSGASALKVALTAIPAGGKRHIRVPGPETFCGDTVTFNFWTPTGSNGLTVQAYLQYNNWSGWAGAVPTVINHGDYTQVKLNVPDLGSSPPVGPGGYQALGIEIVNDTGAAFTGDVYLDDVMW